MSSAEGWQSFKRISFRAAHARAILEFQDNQPFVFRGEIKPGIPFGKHKLLKPLGLFPDVQEFIVRKRLDLLGKRKVFGSRESLAHGYAQGCWSKIALMVAEFRTAGKPDVARVAPQFADTSSDIVFCSGHGPQESTPLATTNGVRQSVCGHGAEYAVPAEA